MSVFGIEGVPVTGSSARTLSNHYETKGSYNALQAEGYKINSYLDKYGVSIKSSSGLGKNKRYNYYQSNQTYVNSIYSK